MNLLSTCCCFAVLVCTATHSAEGYRGDLTLQAQLFTQNQRYDLDTAFNSSLSGFIEYYKDIGTSNGRITIAPFARIDQRDDNRTHVDFRQFLYSHYGDTWEFNAGLGQVFWGVVESRNIVDSINQLDFVEGPTTSEKLGQPMINYTLIHDWGNVDLYVLPGFRERTFASETGRPTLSLPIDSQRASYEAHAGEYHVDVAVRYSRSLEEWDLAIGAFQGTSREPLLRLTDSGDALSPFYYQTTHILLDVQGTFDNGLLKFEAAHLFSDAIKDHSKLVAGYEYTVYGIADTAMDIGLLSEYLYDGLGEGEVEVFQNELIGGIRLSINDEQSTEATLAVAIDLDDGSQFATFKASRRMAQSFKWTIEGITYADENYLGTSIGWFF